MLCYLESTKVKKLYVNTVCVHRMLKTKTAPGNRSRFNQNNVLYILKVRDMLKLNLKPPLNHESVVLIR